MLAKTSFRNLGESMNPVFIKEMRQYFQNRRMLLLMGALLLGEFVLTLFFSSAMSLNNEDTTSGVIFFLLIICGGCILSVFICSIGAEQRFAEERSDRELNYAMLTTLRPASIIWGKLQGALVMLLCIFSMLLPFLTAAYFMRGLSVASLLLTLYILPVLLLTTLAGIFAGTFGLKWLSILYFIGLLNFGIGVVPVGFAIAEELIDGGALDLQFWVYLLVEYEAAFLVGALFFLLSVAIISPPKSNRMFWPKLYLFALPVLSLLMIAPYYIILAGPDYPHEMFYVIEYLFCGFTIAVLAIMSLFEPPGGGIRINMKCPRKFIPRCVHFVFSSGFPGSVTLALPILLLPIVLMPLGHISGYGRYAACGILCMLSSFVGYVLLGLILSWRTRLAPPPWLWVIIFELVANIAPWIPVSIEGSLSDLPKAYHVAMMVLSPSYSFVAIIDSPRRYAVQACIISLVLVGVLYLILFPAIVKAFKLHRYPEHAIKQPTAEMLKKP